MAQEICVNRWYWLLNYLFIIRFSACVLLCGILKCLFLFTYCVSPQQWSVLTVPLACAVSYYGSNTVSSVDTCVRCILLWFQHCKFSWHLRALYLIMVPTLYVQLTLACAVSYYGSNIVSSVGTCVGCSYYGSNTVSSVDTCMRCILLWFQHCKFSWHLRALYLIMVPTL